MGSLLYLSTHNCPTITFSKNFLRLFKEIPLLVPSVAAKGILRYLVSTIDQEIFVGNMNRDEICMTKMDLALSPFSDSVWARNTQSGKYICGCTTYTLVDL